MQFRVDAEIQALTRDLQALAMDHRIVVCTNNRPYAIAMATSFAWASASHPGQLLGICTKPAEALALLPDEAQPCEPPLQNARRIPAPHEPARDQRLGCIGI